MRFKRAERLTRSLISQCRLQPSVFQVLSSKPSRGDTRILTNQEHAIGQVVRSNIAGLRQIKSVVAQQARVIERALCARNDFSE